MKSPTNALLSVAAELVLFRCEHPGLVPPFHRTVLLLFQSLGAEFYQCMPFPQKINPTPVNELTKDGDLLGFIDFTHPLLQTVRTEPDVVSGFQGNYRMTVLRNQISIGSLPIPETVSDFASCIQELTKGRIAFAKLLIPHTLPRLAFVDQTWGTVLSERQLEDCILRHLFWCTYFGPAYVEKYGIDFFKNAPVWKVEEFAGGVFVTVTERFIDFALNEPKESLAYMRQRFSSMRANRFKISARF